MKIVTLLLISLFSVLLVTDSVDSAPQFLQGLIPKTLNVVKTTLNKVVNLVEGDIVDDKNGFYAYRTWPDGIIYYEVSKDHPNMKMINLAMETIESKTCIRYKTRTTQRDYIKITNGTGCWSHVGRVGGGQELSLGVDCFKLQTIVHEFLHVVGLYHEHTRTDRDHYIKIETANIIPGTERNFIKRTIGELRTWFDFQSVMLYKGDFFSRDKANKPTLVSKIKGQQVIDADYKTWVLSRGDVEMVKILYGCN